MVVKEISQVPQTIKFIDVLNAQAEWTQPGDASTWLSQALGQPVSPDKEQLAEFDQCLNFIRQQLTALHFGETLDLQALNERLKHIKLEFAPTATQSGPANSFPLLRAQAKEDGQWTMLKSLQESLVLQFAVFLADCLETGTSVSRCEGLYREQLVPGSSASKVFELESEKKWRQEIELLAEPELESSNIIQRCADIFMARPKARFCSESCRFRTFQLIKQHAEPGYLAEKQRRYRSRQKP